MRSEKGEEFLISRGAPFYQLQKRLGLLADDAHRSGRRALVFVVITAGAPIILGLIHGGFSHVFGMLTGPSFVARFILFIAICFLMERSLEARFRAFLARFGESGLLPDSARPKAAEALNRALGLRNSWAAEVICLILALGLSLYAQSHFLTGAGRDWLLTTTAETGNKLTPAGWWVTVVSSSVFWFLLFRWLWRVFVWGFLLSRIAKLDLRLVVTHPDGMGGLAFIGRYPNSFVAFVLGISCVFAADVYRLLGDRSIDATLYSELMAVWILIVLVLFSLPLAVFIEPLSKLRDETLRHSDPLDTEIQRNKERTIFGRNLMVPDDDETDAEALTDPAAFRKAANTLTTILISRRALVPLGVAALAPLLLAGATQLPMRDLLKAAKVLLVI